MSSEDIFKLRDTVARMAEPAILPYQNLLNEVSNRLVLIRKEREKLSSMAETTRAVANSYTAAVQTVAAGLPDYIRARDHATAKAEFLERALGALDRLIESYEAANACTEELIAPFKVVIDANKSVSE